MNLEKPMTRLRRPLLFVVASLIAISILIFGLNQYRQAKALQAQLEELKNASSQDASEAETRQLVEALGKLIVLPEGEQPTVATISDREKLKEVPFFTKAENGDKVLMYVNARKAYLYRPSSQKIIEVATLNLNTNQQNFAPKIALRNGTAVAGLTKKFEDEVLKAALPKAEVTTRDNAKATTFTETLVIDLSGAKKDDAQRVAMALGAKIGTLPSGESKPADADFLVIIGQDKAISPSPQD